VSSVRSLSLGCRDLYFSTTSVVRLWFTPTGSPVSSGILCVTWKAPHITNSFQAGGVVIGARNLSKSSNRSRRSTWKLTHSDNGMVLWHNGGMTRARASRQKELSRKMPSHHCRHRSSVRRSIPNASRSPLRAQASDHGPWPKSAPPPARR
jgi:hypothetical protein